MQEAEIVITDAPPEAAWRVVNEGLAEHGRERAGYWNATPLGVLVREPPRAEIVGGLLGRSSLGLLFIDLVFIPPPLRNRGIGTRVLAAAEEEALRRGCIAGVLYTISFQAPDFYAHRGWREFGRVACQPPGTSRIFMTKELPPQPA